MKTLISILTYIFFLGYLPAAHAAVSVEENLSDSGYPVTCMNFRVNITDQLNTNDIKKLQNALDNINKKSQDAPCLNRKLVVWLDSTGGEVLAAIELGRILRKNEVHVVVKNECSSSCVFVFAGGVRRVYSLENPKIGIHRPYFENLSASLSADEIRKRREFLNSEIKKYFEEIDVSPSLLGAMLSVPPEKIRYLSIREIDEFRLSFDDASFEEKDIAREAYRYGMTSAEFRRKNSTADNKCFRYALNQESEKHEICRLSVILQITEDEAKRRIAKKFSCIDQKKYQWDELCLRNAFTKGVLK